MLSSTNLSQVSSILKHLEEQVKKNQRMVMEAVEKIDSLYERLQMEMNEKFQFLAENQVSSLYHRVFIFTVFLFNRATAHPPSGLSTRKYSDWRKSRKPTLRSL